MKLFKVPMGCLLHNVVKFHACPTHCGSVIHALTKVAKFGLLEKLWEFMVG